MRKIPIMLVAGMIILMLSSCGQAEDLEDISPIVIDNTVEIIDDTDETAKTPENDMSAQADTNPAGTHGEEKQSTTDETGSDKTNDTCYDVLARLSGEYEYTSDYGTGRLIIEKADDGYNISDYESESSYRFLAHSSNIETIEDNNIYIEYPELLLSDDTVHFSYYILQYDADGIDVYYGMTTPDKATFLYHAAKQSSEDMEHNGNELSENTADELLDLFLNGSISAASSTDSTSTFYITDLNMDSGEWDSYSIGEKVDLDNDGENELIICGPYGGIYLDARDNKVYEFAAGDGTGLMLSYVVYNGATWIMYSNRMHAGYKAYHMEKFEGADNLVAEMDFSEEAIDANNIELGMKYTLNGTEISYEEYYELGSKIFATEIYTD